MSLPAPLCLVANARLPSQRAQSLQVVQMAAAFARTGVEVALLHARRHPTPPLPPGQDLFQYYGVGPGPRPAVEALPCVDWIDRVPRPLQYLPARVQELSFARSAARRAASAGTVYCREPEAARTLLRRGHPAVFLEIHRVPGGRTRLRWLREAGAAARGLVAISGGVAEDLAHLGLDPASIRVEHDGFEPARFAELPTREEARARLDVEPDAPLVVYTGSLLPWKGVDVLVEAARTLPDVRFLVAGGMDADVARLRAATADVANVRVDGFQPPERVVDYLVAADVGVVPNRSTPTISARYTSPLKVFEAMAVGLPLVASNLASLRDVLQEKKSTLGRLTAPDSAPSLARALRELLDDPAERADIRERSLAKAPYYSWDARAARLVAWMEERLGSCASST